MLGDDTRSRSADLGLSVIPLTTDLVTSVYIYLGYQLQTSICYSTTPLACIYITIFVASCSYQQSHPSRLTRFTSSNMFIPVLPLYQATLLSSVSMTSFTLFSNFANRSMGIIPLINQKYEPFPIGPKQKVKAWNSFFSRAMVSSILLSLCPCLLSCHLIPR